MSYSTEDHDEDLRREAIDECRALSKSRGCVCGNDLPGRCPGRLNCPYSGEQKYDEEEIKDEIEVMDHVCAGASCTRLGCRYGGKDG